VLAQQIGAYHVDCNVDSLVGCVVALFTAITGKTPRFRVDGGSNAENLALQNIQVGQAGHVLLYIMSVTGVVHDTDCT
jgi:NAD+ synthase (glutamine-hydrolysing)